MTEWGPQSHGYARAVSRDIHVLALAETHVAEGDLPRWRGVLQADGWKLAATPAERTLRSKIGTHGGEWVLCRPSLASTSFEGERRHWQKQGVDMFHGLCPTVLHLKAGNVVVISAYWLPGDGVAGANAERVRSYHVLFYLYATPGWSPPIST